MKAKVLAFSHHKGGVAKTTTTHNVGAVLASKGYKVLLIDLDPQMNLTTVVLDREPQRTIADAFREQKNLPIVAVTDNLSICPSSTALAGTELLISGYDNRERVLQGLINTVRADYDYILLDCPPSLNLITVNALAATDGLIICLTAEVLPYRGLLELFEKIILARNSLNRKMQITGILVTRYRGVRNMCKLILQNLRNDYPSVLFKTVIRENVKIAEAPMYHKDVTTYAPNSTGAQDYTALTDEIIERLNKIQ